MDQPEQHDPESMTICNECVSNVTNFYAFKQKVLNVQNVLTQEEADMITKHVMIDDQSFIIQQSMMPIELEKTAVLEVVDLHADEHQTHRYQRPTTHRMHRLQPTDEISADEDTTVILNGTMEHVRHQQTVHTVSSPKRLKRTHNVTNDSSEKFSLQVYECLVCPAVLGDILQLNDHIQQHDDIRCKVCMRNFQRYANLKRHFASMHSKPKPFVCDMCGLGFSFSVNLQRHAELHYDKKIKTTTKH